MMAFSTGMMMAAFRLHGTMPVVRDVLMFVMVSKRISRFSRRGFGLSLRINLG